MTPNENTTLQNNGNGNHNQSERIARFYLAASILNMGASLVRLFTRFWP